MLLCIPQEVLLDVASHLDIHDKLNLMTTCSMLNSLILDRSLYQVLSFYGEKEPTEQVVSKFKSNQYNGHQVKRLELKLDCLSDSVFSQLPDIFPNVTRIFDYSDNTSESKRNATTLDSLLKWKDTIEYSGTSEDRFKVARLLAKVEFSRLTELDITFSYFEYNDNCLYGTESVIHISAFVKNAPLLKRLRLYGCAMDLNLLEGIHQSCPNLFFLALEGYLNVNSLSIPVIEPANNLLHLSLGWELMICDQQCLFLDYIVDKYPNLNHLLFFPTFAKYMVTFVLHKFYSDEFNDNGSDGPVTASRRADFENTRETYFYQGGVRLLSRLPNDIETLEMDATLFNHIIPSLQQTQINPHKLYFQKRFQHAQVFLQPHELGYLKSVTSLKQMRLTLGSSMQAYEDEIASLSLIKLTISIKGQDAFNVGWLLSIFPSLEELVIDISSAMLIAGNSNVIYPKLRKLRVEECIIHPNLLGFITTVAPNIQKLAWSLLGKSYHHMIIKKHYRDRECRQRKSSDNPVMSYRVDVSKLSHLEMFKLQINRGQQGADREYDIYGTIKVQGQTRKLVFSENYKPALEVTHNKEAEMEDLEKMSKVTVICDQIKRLKINYNIRIEKDNDDINVVL